MTINGTTSSAFSSAAMGLTLLLLMLAAAFWLVKRSQSQRSLNQGLLVVLASQALGPAQQLQLVQIGDRTLLLGVCSQSITLLLNIEGPLPTGGHASATSVKPSVNPSFNPSFNPTSTGFTQLLQSMVRR
jgi:flagellar biosynthetic protein FliO